MNKVIRMVALAGVLGVAATGCQKESITNPAMSEISSVYMVCYSIDGETSQITLYGEQARREFMEWLFTLVEQGHRVSFRNANTTTNVVAGKEVVTYTTTDQELAITWCLMMEDKGYDVSMKYDSKTGVYTCTAIK